MKVCLNPDSGGMTYYYYSPSDNSGQSERKN